jgi:hypothetical protein
LSVDLPASGAQSELLARASAFALAAFRASGRRPGRLCPSLETIAAPISGRIFSNGGPVMITGSGSVSSGPDGVDAPTCPLAETGKSGVSSPLTKSCRSDSVALLSLMANQRWRWDDRARFRMT